MIKDKHGNELQVGDTVVFSDAGRGGSVHVGIITEVLVHHYDTSVYFRLAIRDADTKRINLRYSTDILKYFRGAIDVPLSA